MHCRPIKSITDTRHHYDNNFYKEKTMRDLTQWMLNISLTTICFYCQTMLLKLYASLVS
jgi:hypothetical protein